MNSKKIIKFITAFISILVVFIFFQNCSSEEFNLAEYGGGSAGENTVDTTPVVSAPTLLSRTQDLTVGNGQTAVFSVVATGGGLRYSWKKDNVELSTTETLIINNVDATKTGVYALQIANTMGSLNESFILNAIPLANQGPARIITPPRSAFTFTGRSVTFQVVAEGENLTYQWYFRRLGSTTENIITGATAASYRIASASLGQNGTFRVEVRNALATVSASADLEVETIDLR